jgi:hypothetical protein
MQKIGIQKIFWDAFELAVSTQANRLARDIADCLGKDPAPLLLSLKNEKVGVYLFDDSQQDDVDVLEMRCPHVCQIGKWKTPCMEPVLWSANPVKRTGACLQHSLEPEPKDAGSKEFIKWENEGSTYYISTEEGHIYTKEGVLCGRYTSKKITLFEIS